jgi:hypothetical protein
MQIKELTPILDHLKNQKKHPAFGLNQSVIFEFMDGNYVVGNIITIHPTQHVDLSLEFRNNRSLIVENVQQKDILCTELHLPRLIDVVSDTALAYAAMNYLISWDYYTDQISMAFNYENCVPNNDMRTRIADIVFYQRTLMYEAFTRDLLDIYGYREGTVQRQYGERLFAICASRYPHGYASIIDYDEVHKMFSELHNALDGYVLSNKVSY